MSNASSQTKLSLLFMGALATSCGSAKLSGAKSGSDSSSTNSTGKGGAMALSEPTAVDASVANIQVLVLNAAACDAASGGKASRHRQGNDGHDRDDNDHDGNDHARDHHRRPPPHGQHGGPFRPMAGQGPMRPGMAFPGLANQAQPPGTPQPQANQSDWINWVLNAAKQLASQLPASTVAASTTSSTTASAALDDTSATGSVTVAVQSGTVAASQCVVQHLQQAYSAGQSLTLSSIPAGTYMIEVILSDSANKPVEEGSTQVTIVDGQTANATVTVADVTDGSAAQLAISSATASQAINACNAISIQSLDRSGTVTPVASAATVSLSSSASSGAFYSDSNCTTAVTTASLAANSANVTVYYKDTLAGTPTLSFADTANPGLGQASGTATVTPLAPSKLASSSPHQAVNTCGSVTITPEDAAGDASATVNALTLSLSSSATTGTFYSDNLCTLAVTSLSLAAATSTATVYYKDSAVGTPTLTFADQTAAGFGQATSTATISAQ